MFRVLEHFAEIKNGFASTVYKTLTFLLVEFYWEVEVREMMLKYFIQLFYRFENIPISILCEPLLKQLEISQYHASSFNVFDFEFFRAVSLHKKLNVQTGLLLMDSISKIALSSVFYSQIATQTLRTLIMRFST